MTHNFEINKKVKTPRQQSLLSLFITLNYRYIESLQENTRENAETQHEVYEWFNWDITIKANYVGIASMIMNVHTDNVWDVSINLCSAKEKTVLYLNKDF